jgi:hypothetical protein
MQAGSPSGNAGEAKKTPGATMNVICRIIDAKVARN